MGRLLAIVLFLALLFGGKSGAIETNGAFNTSAPTDSDIPNWTTGWGASNVTGWDYVGEVNNASGVYLGNGWVLTAAHVGAGTFVLGNGPGAGTYQPVGATQSISNTQGTADLVLFRITPMPSLPRLLIRRSPPVAFSASTPGTMVALLGFGGSNGLTWGYDTITEIDEAVTPDGFTYVSNDFFTDNGTITDGSSSITNNSTVVSGDSGGGDFAFNPTTQQWELEGINEVIGSYGGTNKTFSGYVQLDTYVGEINGIVFPPTDTPTMPFPGLVILAGALTIIALRQIRHRSV